MGYGPDFRNKIRNINVWQVIAEQTNSTLETVPELKAARASCEGIAIAVQKQVESDRTFVKIANTVVGDLTVQLNPLAGQTFNPAGFLAGKNIKNLPSEIEDSFKKQQTGSVDQFIVMLKGFTSAFTADIELLNKSCQQAREHVDMIKKIWAHKCQGSSLPATSNFVVSYMLMLDQYLVKLHSKHQNAKASDEDQFADAADGEESAYADPDQGTTGYGNDDTNKSPYESKSKYRGPGDGRDARAPEPNSGRPKNPPDEQKQEAEPSAKSYAAAAQNAQHQQAEQPPQKRWGDYTSSSEEEDDFSSLMGSFGKTGVSSKSFIEVPKDFEEKFPRVHRAWVKLATKWGWDVKVADCTFSAEGFIGSDYGAADEQERIAILSKLKDTERINLNTFCAGLLSVLYQPEDIATQEHGPVISGFVTSLFLRDKYKNDERSMKLMQISLKGQDAGQEMIRSRYHACFKTGSKCASTLFATTIKMLTKIISRCTDDVKERVCSNSDLCFTSYHGMMGNCFHTVSRKVVEDVEATDKRGKTKRTRKTTMRSGKDVPNLSAAGLELNQKESEKIRAHEVSFNKLNEVVEELLEKNRAATDPLKTAKVVKCVVELAYSKLSTLRRLNKERRNAIRAKAQALAGEGKNVTSAEWLKSRKELLSSFEEISDDTYASFKWDADAINSSLGLV